MARSRSPIGLVRRETSRYRGRMSDSATAITNLLNTYAFLIDAGKFDEIGELFAHATLTDEQGRTMGKGREGSAAVYHRATRLYADGTPRTKHVFTNPIVEIDEASDTATVRAYYTVFQQTDALPLQPIICGQYRDTFERVDGTWRYSGKQFFVDLVGEMGHHLLMDLEEARRPEK
jgi:3-phenylpropionate/cinnamic acid dioxygenase small subunit